MPKEYIYENEKFIVNEPKDCKMQVSGMGLEATISVNAKTNQYRAALDGCGGYRYDNLNKAVKSACSQIFEKVNRQPAKALCSEMDKFYENLNE